LKLCPFSEGGEDGDVSCLKDSGNEAGTKRHFIACIELPRGVEMDLRPLKAGDAQRRD
jgi:hypothetical protein